MSDYAKPEHHVVTVRTRTEDDWTYLESVECACTAPEDAPCRTYPVCDCEVFLEDEDNPGHDPSGHPFKSGHDCWVKGWFDASPSGEATQFVGTGASDATDCGVPLTDQHGHIDAAFNGDDWLEWWWHGNPKPLDVSLDQVALFTLGGTP